MPKLDFQGQFLITSIFKSLNYYNNAQFLTARHYTNSQNSLISFGYVDSLAKIFQILNSPNENSTTRTNIEVDNLSSDRLNKKSLKMCRFYRKENRSYLCPPLIFLKLLRGHSTTAWTKF